MVCIFGELMTSQIHSEYNWPIAGVKLTFSVHILTAIQSTYTRPKIYGLTCYSILGIHHLSNGHKICSNICKIHNFCAWIFTKKWAQLSGSQPKFINSRDEKSSPRGVVKTLPLLGHLQNLLLPLYFWGNVSLLFRKTLKE